MTQNAITHSSKYTKMNVFAPSFSTTFSYSNSHMILVIVIWFLITLLNSHAIKAQQPNYVYHSCDNTTTFNHNTTYQTNLNTLFTLLSTNATTAPYGFLSATAGQSPPDRVYGLFMCRGDVSNETCGSCVQNATTSAPQKCSRARTAVLWYDECMLRYSNESILSRLQQVPYHIMGNPADEIQPQLLRQVLGSTLDNELFPKAASGGSKKKFAVAETKFSSLRTLYTMVQCTPDLTNLQCSQCLQGAGGIIPRDKQGGRMLIPSCNIRYEFTRFYDKSALSAPPPSSSPVQPPSVLPGNKKISTAIIVAIVVPSGLAVFFLLGCYFLWRMTAKKRDFAFALHENGMEISSIESLQFDFSIIQVATNNFSNENKLGEGGFGEVFKGTLSNGQDVAVKRLAKHSGQGDEEFKNEVMLVARLQHRNLVKLRGFCLEGEEKLLVYEYVPNKSLDYILFDPEKRTSFDWSTRYKIVLGIAKGMLYLHEDSRLRIIHRDLKASNVLLDNNMNPKISDFGTARIFGVDQTQGNTNKIVGTHGYMAPEYAMHGQFSVKSDVYSFGILMLEIITGKKSNFSQADQSSGDLPSYVWRNWQNKTTLEIIDPSLGDSFIRLDATRCIHIGLLCIQEDPADRPTMATVSLMLNSRSFTLPVPQEPAFFYHSMMEGMSAEANNRSTRASINEVSITEVYPR